MNKTIKNKWVKALLSGEYKQGKHKLRSLDNEYCCLGVLCEVEKLSFKKNKSMDCYVVEDNWMGSLSKEFCNQIKLPHDKMEKLIVMNDGDNRTFKQIAAYIKRYL